MSQNLELPSYENISAEEMAAKIGLNVKHIPILVQSFTEESRILLAQLQKAVGEKNYDEIGNTAHSIKGSAGNLKFTELYELAKEVETSARAGIEEYPYDKACASFIKAIESIGL